MLPFMPGPILILMSMTSVMIIVLITNSYRGYEQGITLYDFLIIYCLAIIVTFVACCMVILSMTLSLPSSTKYCISSTS